MYMKTIGVLTSGGDAPGMNAAVRAVVRSAISMGMNVMGIHRGYNGLINGDIEPMKVRDVSEIIHRGGTVLYTARCPEFKTEEGLQKAVENCKKFGIDGIVVIGGDGSYRGARDLSLRGIPCVGVPGTIDNDISSTDYTIGFDTAMNTAMEMVDRLRDTAQSHERCSVVEVMGRNAGYLALETGIAVGAIAIMVPEIPYEVEDVCKKINLTRQSGKQHFIVIVAEGVEKSVSEIAKEIEESTGVESRATVLGHVQRGGNPTVRDRVMASYMGNAAVELLNKGIGNRVICYDKGIIIDRDIYEALQMKKPFDVDGYRIADSISM
ncbi:MAG: 6-phosphofructokinase [Acutalibacteraceae bacterium]|nr:6-phosphofructokinase [Acutalibacteraceae bacterium]